MSELASEIDLYDHDRLAINKVVHQLRQSIGKRRDTEGFAREVMDRFAEAGFYVDVSLSTEDNHTINTEIVITGRIEPEAEFDHDRMGHEVRSNLLGVKGQDNVQKTVVGQTGFSSTPSGLIVPRSN